MEHIRGFYAKEMKRLGFGPRSIKLDYDKTGALRIHLATGDKPFARPRPSPRGPPAVLRFRQGRGSPGRSEVQRLQGEPRR